MGPGRPLYDDFNIGHFVKPWIENESDLECFKQVRRLSDTREILAEERAGFASRRNLADRFSLAMTSHVGMGLTGAMQLFGASPLCMMIENPGLVDACLEHEHRINLRTIEVLGDLGVDYVHRNGFYETADFYSPAMLERFIGRRLRREADAAHAAGMLAVYTVHTGVMPILDYLASLTMDSFFGIDIAFKDVDLRKVKGKLAPNQEPLDRPQQHLPPLAGAGGDASRGAASVRCHRQDRPHPDAVRLGAQHHAVGEHTGHDR